MPKKNLIKEPEVHCAYDEISPIDNLVEHPRNPNQHSAQQIILLAKIIGGQGWRAPIIISKRSGFIIAGHARFRAAKLLDLKTVPINLQSFKTEADENSHLIADNRIAELAEMDTATLKDLLIELDTGETDMDFTGYTATSLGKLMRELDGPDDKPQIICPKCGEQFTA